MAGGNLLPGEVEGAFFRSAIGEVEVDEGLVGKAGFFGFGFEIVHRSVVDIDGDLLFESVGVRVFAGV